MVVVVVLLGSLVSFGVIMEEEEDFGKVKEGVVEVDAAPNPNPDDVEDPKIDVPLLPPLVLLPKSGFKPLSALVLLPPAFKEVPNKGVPLVPLVPNNGFVLLLLLPPPMMELVLERLLLPNPNPFPVEVALPKMGVVVLLVVLVVVVPLLLLLTRAFLAMGSKDAASVLVGSLLDSISGWVVDLFKEEEEGVGSPFWRTS